MSPQEIRHGIFPSIRFFICLLLTLGVALNISLFSTIYFAWVCMVNDTSTSSYNETVDLDSNKFNWDKQAQQHIFAGYHLGGVASLLASSTLIRYLGAKNLFASGLMLEIVASALIPFAAGFHYLAVAFLRILTGVGSAVFFPIIYETCIHWGSKSELGTLFAMMMAGLQIGNMMSLVFDGVECLNLGWQYIFYIPSNVALLFLVMWMLFYDNDPAASRWISEEEKVYILMKRTRTTKKDIPIPYKAIFRAGAVWSVILSGASAGCIGYMASFLPTYFNEVLKLSITTNGLFSALPWLAMLIGRLMSGPLSDKKYCFKSHGPVIKLCNTTAFGVAGLGFLGMTFVSKNTPKPLVLGLLFTIYVFFMFITGGFLKASLYFAPQFSGFIGSIQSAFAYIASVLVPYLVSAMTSDGTAEQWHYVFYMCMCVCAFSAIFFLIFGAAEVQPWAKSVDINHISSTATILSLESDKTAEKY